MSMKSTCLCILSLLLMLCVLLPVAACFLLSCTDEREGLRVAVLDVGQSDAILLSQGEHHLLIDCGTTLARNDLLGELSYLGVDELEYLLLTHLHEDHIGNARVLLERYPVGALLTSAAESADSVAEMTYGAAAESNCTHTVLRKGDSFALGDACCEVLFAANDADDEPNNGSIVLRVQYGETVLLFTGDAEAALEETLLYYYPDGRLDCDFLKVGHHGSDTATTDRFLAATTPHFAAISCGKDNEYGFPHKRVLDSLAACGAVVARTDISGTLIYESDGEALRFYAWQGYRSVA